MQLLAAVGDDRRPGHGRPKNERVGAPGARLAQARASISLLHAGGSPSPPSPSGKCTHASPASYWAPGNSNAVMAFGSCTASSSSTRAVTRSELLVSVAVIDVERTLSKSG